MTETFGRYELVDQIGTGGMAEVYLAKSVGAEGLEKELVIKKILPEYAEDESFVEMFITEADIAVGLNHPNIVQIYDFGKVGDDYYLAMEYVDGPDLGELLEACERAGEPLGIGEAVYTAAQVAKGLHYAHQRQDDYGEPLGLVHRDISPENILISRQGAVKIVDFGIAKATSAADEDDEEVVKGKFQYMSPEQASGEAVDHRSDIFSLGVVLFEMVCGQPLFEQETPSETMSLVKSAVVPDISSLNRAIPERLEALLYKTLERDPEDRPETARELEVELTKVLYDFGEIHDSMTLARQLESVAEHLEAEGAGTTEQKGTPRTSVLDTVPETAANADAESPGTTPAETVFQEEPRDELPPAVARERKEAVFIHGELDGLMELKRVIDEDRTWIQVVEEYSRIVDSITFKTDGRVHHVDERGFLILLGIPFSSENDAVRGARVAMDLQEAISGMNLSLEEPIELQIGVAAGDVMVEQQEEGEKSQYNWSFHGSSYEYAEDLASEALGGEILVSPRIYRRIRREFDCEPLEERADQQDEGPDAYQLAGPKTPEQRIQQVRRSYYSLYGREIPLKVLRGAFREAVLEDRASGVAVLGEHGVGKSTLLEEFLSGLDERDARLIRDVATPADRDVPLGTMASLFGDLMRLGEGADRRKLRETLERRIDALFPGVDATERELLLHSIGSLFDVRYGKGRFEELDREDRRTRIFLSLRKVLDRFADRKPIVVAIDDAHYLDSVSLEFLAQYFESTREHSVFFVFAAESTGDHEESEQWEAFLDAEAVEVERLEELTTQEAKRMIGDMLRGHGVDSGDLVDEIYRRSGGNPMYIKEVIDVLKARDQLDDIAEATQLEPFGEQPGWLPSSVEDFIAAKIDRLELDAKEVLRKLALLWSPFTAEEAELVVEEDDPADILESLVRRDFLERADVPEGKQGESYDAEEVPADERRYRFANALTREVAAQSLVPEEAEEYHGRIAERLSDEHGGSGGGDAALLARHLEGAGREEEALEYYLEAADTALEQFGAAEALRLADRARELVDAGSRDEFEVQQLRERALTNRGAYEEAEAVLDRLVELADEVGEPDERIDVLLRSARFYSDRADFDRAREFIEEARDLAEAEGRATGRAEAWFVEAGLLMSEGDREGALGLVEQAIEIFGREDADEYRRGLARCLNMKGIILRRSGRYRESLEMYDRALEHAREVEDRTVIRYLLNNSGLALVYLGEYSEALERYLDALERSQRLGHRRDQAEYYVNIGHAYYLLGQTEDAVSMIRKGIYRGRQAGIDADVANGMISLGLCYLERDELESADRSLHEGLRIADSIPDAYFGVHAMFALAKVRLASGDPGDAETALMQAEDGVERARDADMDWGVPYGDMLAARALQAMGRREEAIERAEQAVELARSEDRESGYATEEIYYHYAEILPDEREEERREAIEQARDIVEGRREAIENPAYRESFASRPINRKIANVAEVLLDDGESSGTQ